MQTGSLPAAGDAFWRPLPWQQELWIELTAQILQGRLSHALMLSGPQGVGKRWFARALVAFLLCEQRSGYACGRCRSCQQLAVGAHPNACLLGPDGLLGLAITASGQHEQGLVHWQPDADRKRRDISIEASRKLISQLTLASHYGGARTSIIDPADALNSNSVNALLKTIEEPPPDTHLLLLSERPQALLPTLRSRCQKIAFAVPEESAALQWLQAQQPSADAALLPHHGPTPALAEVHRAAERLEREFGVELDSLEAREGAERVEGRRMVLPALELAGDGFQVDGGARGLHPRRQQPHVARPGLGR